MKVWWRMIFLIDGDDDSKESTDNSHADMVGRHMHPINDLTEQSANEAAVTLA